MQIDEKQKNKIKEVAEKYHLNLVLLFGSRATGRTHKESDFDVAYLPQKNLNYDDEIDINFQFTNIFRHDRVDTVDMRKAPPLASLRYFS